MGQIINIDITYGFLGLVNGPGKLPLHPLAASK